ncbi:hypothetical protein ACFY7V_03680 [[Kitasatospora] papulosa]
MIYSDLAVGLIGWLVAIYGRTSYYRAVGASTAGVALVLALLSPMAW